MRVSARELGTMLNGEVVGNADVLISAPSKIEEGAPGTISFYANPKYEEYIYKTEASVLLVPRDFQPSQPIETTLIKVDDVYECITKLLDQFGGDRAQVEGISTDCHIHQNAIIGQNVSVGEFSTISKGAILGNDVIIFPQVFIGENVSIGSHVTIHPGARIHHGTIIGDHCVVQSNSVIGGDGFGYLPQKDGTFKKVNHTGNVVLEDYVEIGCNVTIDKATMGSTIIKQGVKLDNLIHLAHNVEIGSNTAIAAQTGVAGSTKIGENCLIGGQSGIVGHIEIADGTRLQAKSGVHASVKEPNQEMYGYPAIKYSQYQRSYIHFKNLPDLVKQIHALQKRIEELEK